MRDWFWVLLVACLLVACDEDLVVGSNQCDDAGGACVGPVNPFIPVRLFVDFQSVDMDDAGTLQVDWTMQNPCAAPCTKAIELHRGGYDSVWTVDRTSDAPKLTLIDGKQFASDVALTGLLPNTPSSFKVYATSDQNGTVTTHSLWTGLDAGLSAQETLSTLLVDAGLVAPGPKEVQEELLTPQTMNEPYPTGVLPVASEYLFFGLPGDQTSTLSLVDATSLTLRYQSHGMPSYSQSVGGSAAAIGVDATSFVVAANDGDAREPVFGILQLDQQLGYQQFSVASDSTWHSALVVPWRVGEYAVAASSNLVSYGLPGTGDGNIDIVAFPSGGPKPIGFRIMRTCIYQLTINGFSSDSSGTMYITTIAGVSDAPRGLLCRMPITPNSRAQCWQTEVNMLLGAIVAAESGSVFVVIGPYDPTGDLSQNVIAHVTLQ